MEFDKTMNFKVERENFKCQEILKGFMDQLLEKDIIQ